MELFTRLNQIVLEHLNRLKLADESPDMQEACNAGRLSAEDICAPALDELIEAFKLAEASGDPEDYRYAYALLGDNYIDITEFERYVDENK